MDDNTKDTIATAVGCTAVPVFLLFQLVFWLGGVIAVLSVIFWLIGLIFGHHAPPE